MIAQEHYRNAIESQLRGLIASYKAQILVATPHLDRWLATSLLQKSIRRDEPELAWQAASHLLENHPTYFWRRLPIIALEDIGIGDVDLTMMAILAGSSSTLRLSLGGCLLTATGLIDLMCKATKDRSTDDLFDVVSRSPALREERVALFEEGTPDDLFGSAQRLHGVRELANLMFVQAGCIDVLPVTGLKKGVWADVIHVNATAKAHIGLIETSLFGLKSTGLVLAPMLLAVGKYTDKCTHLVDDMLPESPKGTKIPTWALGQHTRVGLDGFRRYINKSQRIRDLLSEASDGTVSRPKTIGGLIYRLDCGQLLHRRACDHAAALKEEATGLGWGISDTAVTEALSILKGDFDLINACRADALKDHLS